jgi:hypothetical protein
MMAIIARTTPTMTGVGHADGRSAEDKGGGEVVRWWKTSFLGVWTEEWRL